MKGPAMAYAMYISSSRMLAAGVCRPRLSSMNRPGSSGDVVPLSLPGEPRRWQPTDTSTSGPHLSQHSSTQQQQQHPCAPTTTAISADASAPANYSYRRSSTYAPLPVTAEVLQEPQAAAAAGAGAAPDGALVHVHAPFLVLFAYFGGMAACATSPDWYMDCAWFAGIWAGLWATCCRLHPSPRTVVLLNLVPVMHMSGALGTYHWELGNLSWDILTHITNGFVGTLLFASCLADKAAGHSATQTAAAPHQEQHVTSIGGEAPLATEESRSGTARLNHAHDTSTAAAAAAAPNLLHGTWQKKARGVLQLSLLLLAGTTLIEVVEAYGGMLAGQGEGIFLRGAGDFCTVSLPCSEEVDTMKDMVDNVAGMMLALLALSTGSRGSNSSRA